MDFALLLSGNNETKIHWDRGNIGDKWRIKSIKIESGREARSTHTKIERMEGKG